MKFRLCESIEYDSEGNPLSEEQVKFFKDSKVRDSQGRLLVCYHSTNEIFDVFDFEMTNAKSLFGRGFYFTTKKQSKYSKFLKRTIVAYINLKTPLICSIEELVRLLEKNNETINDYLVKNSFDGLIVKDFDYVIALKSNQIKSITNKNPTNSDNINEGINNTPTEQQLIDTIQDMEDEHDEIYVGDIDGGSTLLVSTNGDVLIADSWDNHADFLDAVAKKIGFNGHLYDYATEKLGWVTLNNGFGYGDDRFKVVVTKKPTQKQLRVIENWLDLYSEEEYHTGDLVLYANGLTKWVDRDLYTSKDIIKKINKAFQFGILEKKKK